MTAVVISILKTVITLTPITCTLPQRGLEIHGLLVGRNESVPLSSICTDWDGVNRVHNFLCKYDLFNVLRAREGGDRNLVQDPYGLEGTVFPFGDDDEDDVDDTSSSYKSILEFKDISDQLLRSFNPPEPSSSSIVQTPHTSKYDKKKPKLKSGTRLYALPKDHSCSEEHSSVAHTARNRYRFKGDGRRGHLSRLSSSPSLALSLPETAPLDFEYISFLKHSQKLALLAVERKEKKVADKLRLDSLNAAATPPAGVVEMKVEASKQLVDVPLQIPAVVQSPHRELISGALRALNNGLVERDIEVCHCWMDALHYTCQRYWRVIIPHSCSNVSFPRLRYFKI
jgi:hypothetical protein